MVRGLVVGVVVLGLAMAALGYRWLAMEQDSVGNSVDAVGECYPLQEPCRWQTPAGEASVTMSPLEGDELQMNVTLPGEPDRVMIVLTGESMYMGEYPFRLENTGKGGVYRASFVPPFCTTGDDMTWRVNLRVGPETINPPFRLLFHHSGE